MKRRDAGVTQPKYLRGPTGDGGLTAPSSDSSTFAPDCSAVDARSTAPSSAARKLLQRPRVGSAFPAAASCDADI
jgi:hypothetical protein